MKYAKKLGKLVACLFMLFITSVVIYGSWYDKRPSKDPVRKPDDPHNDLRRERVWDHFDERALS